ncbi:MAG: DUF2726 domain-containing protein, partial [Endozoicomonadaceae bacterium]|nr:DUF2726 domain-containing protein [Endozoicomonadaceae bacterium]
MDSTIIYDQIPSIALGVCALLMAALAVSVGSRLRKDTGVHIRKPLYDSAGRSFYSLMDMAVGEHFSLFTDLPLGEVLFTDEYQRPIPAWLLDAQFDMLLCGRRSLTPRCAILVADHSIKKGRRRIDQMRAWFDKAGLPLLVYEAGSLLDVRTLREDVYIAVGVEHQHHCSEVNESASVYQTIDDQPNRSNTRASSA